MKLLAVLLFATLAACDITRHFKLTPEQRTQLLKVNDQCLKENGLLPDELTNLTAEKYTDKHAAGCGIGCIFKNFGLWTPEGGFKISNDILADVRLAPVIEDCAKITNADECIQFLEFYHCYLINAPKTGATHFN